MGRNNFDDQFSQNLHSVTIQDIIRYTFFGSKVDYLRNIPIFHVLNKPKFVFTNCFVKLHLQFQVSKHLQKQFEEAEQLKLHIDYQTNCQQDHSCQSTRDAARQVSCVHREDNTRKREIDLPRKSSNEERSLWKSCPCARHAFFSSFRQTVAQEISHQLLRG